MRKKKKRLAEADEGVDRRATVEISEFYERLRRDVVEGRAGESMGMKLLVGQGMAAWVNAWAAIGCAPGADCVCGPETGAVSREGDAMNLKLPGGAHSEAVRVLANMVLGSIMEE